MKAALLYGPRDVRVEEIPPLEPQGDEALIRIRACGVCPSDVRKYAPPQPSEPLPEPRLIGHEWVGEIVELPASGAGEFQVGDRVAVDWRVICGTCRYCRRGAFNFCLAAEPARVRGGYAEFGCAPLSNLRRLPEQVSFAAAVFCEPLACCLNGMRRNRLDFGDTLVIIGAGPIGLMHLQLAKQRGARVVVCDLRPERLRVAEELGADEVICPPHEDPVARVKALTDGYGAESVLVAVGGVEPARQALEMVDLNGTVNLFAGTYPAATFPLDPNPIHYRQLNLTGSHDFSPQDFTAALQFIATGRVRVEPLISHQLPLSETKRGFDLVMAREGLKVVILC